MKVHTVITERKWSEEMRYELDSLETTLHEAETKIRAVRVRVNFLQKTLDKMEGEKK